MQQSLADLLDALDRAGTPDEVWRVGSEWLVALGVEWCLYSYTGERWEPGARQRIRYSSLPQAWMEHYAAQAFFRVDPATRHCVDAVYQMLTGIRTPARVDGSAWRLREDAARDSAAGSPSPFGYLDPRWVASHWSPGFSVRSSSPGTKATEGGRRWLHMPSTNAYSRLPNPKPRGRGLVHASGSA